MESYKINVFGENSALSKINVESLLIKIDQLKTVHEVHVTGVHEKFCLIYTIINNESNLFNNSNVCTVILSQSKK